MKPANTAVVEVVLLVRVLEGELLDEGACDAQAARVEEVPLHVTEQRRSIWVLFLALPWIPRCGIEPPAFAEPADSETAVSAEPTGSATRVKSYMMPSSPWPNGLTSMVMNVFVAMMPAFVCKPSLSVDSSAKERLGYLEPQWAVENCLLSLPCCRSPLHPFTRVGNSSDLR